MKSASPKPQWISLDLSSLALGVEGLESLTISIVNTVWADWNL